MARVGVVACLVIIIKRYVSWVLRCVSYMEFVILNRRGPISVLPRSLHMRWDGHPSMHWEFITDGLAKLKDLFLFILCLMLGFTRY